MEYDPQYLQIIPEEIIAKDYGCGDPSQRAREGEVVVDLGLGGGKSCCIASKIVGVEGRVIGVDMNDEMLALARKYQPEIIAEIGHDNVEFSKRRIQDLRLVAGQPGHRRVVTTAHGRGGRQIQAGAAIICSAEMAAPPSTRRLAICHPH